jgi:hypothetical protein
VGDSIWFIIVIIRCTMTVMGPNNTSSPLHCHRRHAGGGRLPRLILPGKQAMGPALGHPRCGMWWRRAGCWRTSGCSARPGWRKTRGELQVVCVTSIQCSLIVAAISSYSYEHFFSFKAIIFSICNFFSSKELRIWICKSWTLICIVWFFCLCFLIINYLTWNIDLMPSNWFLCSKNRF